MISDRRVHAIYDNMEIVRYNRAGKWYLEPTIPGLKRQQVSIATAVRSAQWGIANANGQWYRGIAGGSTFDGLMEQGR